MAAKPKKVSTKIKRLLARDGNICPWCEKSMLPKHEKGDNRPKKLCMTLEHIVERKDGGTNHNDNLVLVHYRCNNHRNNSARINKEPTHE